MRPVRSASDRLTASRDLAQRGVTLVDVLVGLAVAMLTMVIVYRAFVAIETVRNNLAATSDAQDAGAFALSLLSVQIGNAGAGIAGAGRWLETCPSATDVAASLRPISVLIFDSGSPDQPDSIAVRTARTPQMAMPAAFATEAPLGANFRIESPDGIAAGDRVIAISRTGQCAAARITGVGAPVAGVVEISHSPVAIDLPAASLLLDLGPAALASTARYDVAAGTLRSTDVANGDAPNPLVANIVNLKFQYGIDSDGDGTLDTWALASAPGPWNPATLLASPRATLDRIKAIRIGVIARAGERDRELTQPFRWVLFDCELPDKSACAGRLEGTIAGTAGGSYRYRAYETVVPLRNVLWDRGP